MLRFLDSKEVIDRCSENGTLPQSFQSQKAIVFTPNVISDENSSRARATHQDYKLCERLPKNASGKNAPAVDCLVTLGNAPCIYGKQVRDRIRGATS